MRSCVCAGGGWGFETEHGADGGASTPASRTGVAPDPGLRPLAAGPPAGGACSFGQQDGSLAAQPRPEATGLVSAATALLGRHSDSHLGPVITLCVRTQGRTRVRPCGFSPVRAHVTPVTCAGAPEAPPRSGSCARVPGEPQQRLGARACHTWACAAVGLCVCRVHGRGQLGPGKDQGSVLSGRRPTALGKQNAITVMMFEKHFFHFPWESGSFRNRGVRWLN